MAIETTWSVSIATSASAAPADGFIDHRRIEDIMAGGSNPTTLAHGRAKARARARYKFLVERLSQYGNIYITDMVATGASATAAASAFSFIAHCERGDQVLSTLDEANAGTTLTDAAALKRFIARALIESHTQNAQVYDPTLTAAPGNTTTAIRNGNHIESLVTGAASANLTAATALITVTKLT